MLKQTSETALIAGRFHLGENPGLIWRPLLPPLVGLDESKSRGYKVCRETGTKARVPARNSDNDELSQRRPQLVNTPCEECLASDRKNTASR